MPAHRGEQSLAGERLWHGSMRHKFVSIAQPRAISSVSVLNCQMCHAGRRMLEWSARLLEKSTYACVQVTGHWGGAYPRPIFKPAHVVVGCACCWIGTPVLLDVAWEISRPTGRRGPGSGNFVHDLQMYLTLFLFHEVYACDGLPTYGWQLGIVAHAGWACCTGWGCMCSLLLGAWQPRSTCRPAHYKVIIRYVTTQDPLWNSQGVHAGQLRYVYPFSAAITSPACSKQRNHHEFHSWSRCVVY